MGFNISILIMSSSKRQKNQRHLRDLKIINKFNLLLESSAVYLQDKYYF